VPHLSEEVLHDRRIAKIESWLDWLEGAEREFEEIVLSRASELASETGADPDPRLRPCEHRPEWMRGGLCLACDNSGLRRATDKERAEGLAYDPYFIDPPRSTFAVTRDESEAARHTANLARLDSQIAQLQANARIRAGVEVPDDRMTALLRKVAGTRRNHPTLRKLEWALGAIRRQSIDLYVRAWARDPEVLELVSRMVRGRIDRAAG
jgi:hypothetical protein